MCFLRTINQKLLLASLISCSPLTLFCDEGPYPSLYPSTPKQTRENKSDYEDNDDDSAHDDEDTPDPDTNPSNLPIYPNCEMGYLYEEGHCIPLNQDPS